MLFRIPGGPRGEPATLARIALAPRPRAEGRHVLPLPRDENDQGGSRGGVVRVVACAAAMIATRAVAAAAW